MTSSIRQHLQVVLLVGIATMSLCFVLTHPDRAQAGHSACRIDPIVYLTNNQVVTMVTDLDVDLTRVNLVAYTVHVPAGVGVDHIIYDVGDVGIRERVNVLSDQSANQYVVEQFAVTRAAARVTATNTIGTTTRRAQGTNQQTLTTVFNNP